MKILIIAILCLVGNLHGALDKKLNFVRKMKKRMYVVKYFLQRLIYSGKKNMMRRKKKQHHFLYQQEKLYMQ